MLKSEEFDTLEQINAAHRKSLRETGTYAWVRLPPHRPELIPQLQPIAEFALGGNWGEGIGDITLIRAETSERVITGSWVTMTLGYSARAEDLRLLMQARISAFTEMERSDAPPCGALMSVISDVFEKSPDPEATQLLIRLLDDPDLYTRQSIALGLARLGQDHPQYRDSIRAALDKRRELLLSWITPDSTFAREPNWLVSEWKMERTNAGIEGDVTESGTR